MSNYLKEIRSEIGMTQQEFANKTDQLVQSHLSSLENLDQTLFWDTANGLAFDFGEEHNIDPEKLFINHNLEMFKNFLEETEKQLLEEIQHLEGKENRSDVRYDPLSQGVGLLHSIRSRLSSFSKAFNEYWASTGTTNKHEEVRDLQNEAIELIEEFIDKSKETGNFKTTLLATFRSGKSPYPNPPNS